MKKIFLLLIPQLIFVGAFCQGRPTQPSIMVIPSLQLMNNLGYTKTVNNMGTDIVIPNYEAAFVKDPNLKLVVSKIGEIFSDRGFSLTNLESSLSSLREEQAEDLAYSSKQGGSIAKNPIDEVLNRVKPDLKLELTYEIISAGGPLKALKFSIEAKDAYTNKQVAAVNEISENTSEIVIIRILKEGVLANINNLQTRIQEYFNDVNQNGREVFLRVNIFDDADFDLEEEFNGVELSNIINDWVKKNSYNAVFRQSKKTENEIRYSEVRIPLFDKDNNPIVARDFADQLVQYLKMTFSIKSKNATQSIGDARIIITGLKK